MKCNILLPKTVLKISISPFHLRNRFTPIGMNLFLYHWIEVNHSKWINQEHSVSDLSTNDRLTVSEILSNNHFQRESISILTHKKIENMKDSFML